MVAPSLCSQWWCRAGPWSLPSCQFGILPPSYLPPTHHFPAPLHVPHLSPFLSASLPPFTCSFLLDPGSSIPISRHLLILPSFCHLLISSPNSFTTNPPPPIHFQILPHCHSFLHPLCCLSSTLIVDAFILHPAEAGAAPSLHLSYLAHPLWPLSLWWSGHNNNHHHHQHPIFITTSLATIYVQSQKDSQSSASG